jgi:predicted nucleic-acid-binding protein
MIAFDTNAIVRMLIEDDIRQAEIVKAIVTQVESTGDQILILPEVLIETVWVLESVYQCKRAEIFGFLEVSV